MPTFIIPPPAKSAISEIELDRLLDRGRKANEPNRPPALFQPPIAANDDQLPWPFIPFPEG